MNIAKLQIETAKELLRYKSCVRYCIDGGEVYFTYDAISAFSIPEKYVILDLARIKSADTIKSMFSIDKDDQEVKPTGILKKTEGRTIMELCGEKVRVWVNESLFKRYYEQHQIICSESLSPVKFVNRATKKVEAVVLPVRVREE